MAESTIEYTYLYPFESQVTHADSGGRLELATSKCGKNYPYFFNGKLVKPHITATLLCQLAKVVQTRFYIPPNMLNKILLERDPVVTSGGGMLRFEGFSACCSTYARVDLSPESYKGSTRGVGTTNVDFNPATKNALAKIRDSDRFQLAVGPDEVMIKKGFEKIIERKVQLPNRWIKGFVEVQAYQRKMEERFSIDKANTIRFLRSIPRSSNNKTEYYVISQGKSLRLSHKASKEAVKISGLKRLDILISLAPFIQNLTIYSDPSGESSEWHIDCEGMSLSLTLTANVARGFSGEGQVLSKLIDTQIEHLSKLRSCLKWQHLIEQSEIEKRLELEKQEVDRGLAILGSQGLVGYDLSKNAYFHREMPFKINEVDTMHPRLKGASKLVENGSVTLGKLISGISHAEVKSSNVTHKVKVGLEDFCTCPWYSKYQGRRGDCKHILAVKLCLQDKIIPSNSGE